jgi:hypothetical protein
MLALLVGVAVGQPPADSGLTLREVPVSWPAECRREDFENCRPAASIKVRDRATGTDSWLVEAPPPRRPENGCWLLRHPPWTGALLNVSGSPGPLTYDPGLTGRHDIVLHLRAVDPVSSIAVRLDGEPAFDVVRTPEATAERHFDVDIVWRTDQAMDGRRVVFRSAGDRVYLQGITFAPAGRVSRRRRVASDKVTVARTPGRHYAFPGLARLPGGDLAVVFRDGVAHVCPYGRIAMVRSRDGGRTWTEPAVIAETPSDERDPSIHTLPDGRVLVSFNVWNSWMANAALRRRYAEETARIERDGLRAYTGAKLMLSDDGGLTWDEPFRVWPFSPHGPSLGRDGTLCYASSRTVRPRRLIEFWQGASDCREWTRLGTVGESAFTVDDRHRVPVFGEPHAAQLADGTWLACIRVDLDGYVRLARSSDGGRTWSDPETTAVRGFPQHILPLRDGRVLLAYGYRFAPAGVRAVVSRDNAETWSLEDEIILSHGASDFDLGYPVSIELENGRVFTVYYLNNGDGDCFIEGAFYRP